MGFGNGYSVRHDRGGKRYDNSMVAHVWNAQSEALGQSSNGNFYFNGAALYSYGSHFVVGYIMPDGVAFLNADSYSVSTSGHQSDARGAIKNRRRAVVAGLTDLAGDWKLLPRLASYLKEGYAKDKEAREAMQKSVRATLATYAVALESPILAAGQWGNDSYDYETTPATRIPFDRTGLQEAGAYLAALAGLPAASWPKIKREAAKARAAKAEREAKADRDAAERRALRLSDMEARHWREYMSNLGREYTSHGFESLAKELRRARKLMLAAKSGKLATAGRIATIRARLKQVEAEREAFDAKRQPRLDRHALAIHLATIRAFRDASDEGRARLGRYDMANLERAAQYVAERGRLLDLKASAILLVSMAAQRQRELIAAEREAAARQRENEAREYEERKALWLSGELVGRMRFDADCGGAALRVKDNMLETSHGADVPLEHAVKVFRFVKLIREQHHDDDSSAISTAWRKNGKTIRVGHFQVDRIMSNGDFEAGCHSIKWAEVERVAKEAGVFDCPASDLAVEQSA